MGPIGLQLVVDAGVKVLPGSGRRVCVQERNRLTIAEYADLTLELAGVMKVLRVSACTDEVDIYLGADFIRVFSAVYDPDMDQLYIRVVEKW